MGHLPELDRAIAYVRDEVMPALAVQEGHVGLSMLVDQDYGQCVVTTSWESLEALRAAEVEHALGMRSRGAGLLSGEPESEDWEVVVMHRDHLAGHGAACRATWLELDPELMDRNIDLYRSVLLPQLLGLEGFCSVSLLVDRERGRAVSTGTFDSREAMELSREEAVAMRDSIAHVAGVEIVDAGEYDLVLAHLRVPERV